MKLFIRVNAEIVQALAMFKSPTFWLTGFVAIFLSCNREPPIDEYRTKANVVTNLRVISLAPSLTQAIFSLGADNQLVGRTDYCDYPPFVQGLPSVGRLDLPSYEAILNLEPDWVIVSSLTPPAVVERMRSLGLCVDRFTETGLEGIIEVLQVLGHRLGRIEAAEKCIDEFKSTLEYYRSQTAELPVHDLPRVALIYDLGALYSAGAGTFPNDLIQIAGGYNIASEAGSSWPQLNLEGLLHANPEVIFVTFNGSDMQGVQLRRRISSLQKDPIWSQINAIRTGRIHLIYEDYLSVPSIRSLEALQTLSTAINLL
ncbi:MAG: helical backbone metal receptor [Verrucomicrobiota bacterium]|nr:helical backbone metal receptor [Verrucomicrobiota bacterium]